MKRVRLAAIILVAIAVVSAGVWWLSRSASSPTSTDILTSGFIEAKDVAIASEVSGRITEILVAEGDRATAGALLVRLDGALLKAQQRQAETVIEQAQAGVAQAEAAVEQAQAGLEQVTMSRNQATVARDGARKSWEDALDVQTHPLELEARLAATQGQVDAAVFNLEQAADSFRKITYPYTYSTFALDVPGALGSINDARRQLDGIKSGLRAGLSADQYNELSRQLQQTTDSLTKAWEQLARGQGQDVFQSGIVSAKDFWTLRSAQLQMEAAQAALGTANRTLQIVQAIKSDPQDINAAVNRARSAYDMAVAALGVVEKGVAVAQRQVTIAQRQVAVVQKQVEQAQASLEVLKVQVSKTALTSPVLGVVASRNAEPGEIAQPGVPILVITELDKVTLTAYVPEGRIGQVKLGQKAVVSVDSYPGDSFIGQVTFISPRALFTPGNVQLKEEREKTVFAVKISLDNPEQKLKPGMSADARIIASR